MILTYIFQSRQPLFLFGLFACVFVERDHLFEHRVCLRRDPRATGRLTLLFAMLNNVLEFEDAREIIGFQAFAVIQGFQTRDQRELDADLFVALRQLLCLLE